MGVCWLLRVPQLEKGPPVGGGSGTAAVPLALSDPLTVPVFPNR